MKALYCILSLLFISSAHTYAKSAYTPKSLSSYERFQKDQSYSSTRSYYEVYRAFPYWRTEPFAGPWANLAYAPHNRTLNLPPRFSPNTTTEAFVSKWWRYAKLPSTGKPYFESNISTWENIGSDRIAPTQRSTWHTPFKRVNLPFLHLIRIKHCPLNRAGQLPFLIG